MFNYQAAQPAPHMQTALPAPHIQATLPAPPRVAPNPLLEYERLRSSHVVY